MGLNQSVVQFLLAARAAGVSYQRTATLGRQVFASDVSAPWLQGQLAAHRISADANEILAVPGRFADRFWKAIGAETITSFDTSTYENADVIHDQNLPIGEEHKQKFTVVFDGGTIEHVFHITTATQNCMEMLEVGGHFMTSMVANNLLGHGFYQVSPEWAFRVFSPENGFETRSVLLNEVGIRRPTFYRVDDPAMIHKRVELRNSTAVALLVLARRTAVRPIFQRIPQQSDYVEAWDEGVGLGQPKPAPGPSASPASPQAPAPAPSSAPSPAPTPPSASRLPEFLRWHGPLRTTLRNTRRGFVRFFTRTLPNLPRTLKYKYEAKYCSHRLDWVNNDRGLAAPYYHRLSDEDLVAGRILGK